MEALLAGLEATAIAEHLRLSRYTYPFVNAAHILGIGLLIGAILPLDLRLLGVWRTVPLADLERVLRPVAAAGLGLAVITGGLLFSVSAREYWATWLFPIKMGLVGLGAANALLLLGGRLDSAAPLRRRVAGVLSLGFWVAALLAGRWLAFL